MIASRAHVSGDLVAKIIKSPNTTPSKVYEK